MYAETTERPSENFACNVLNSSDITRLFHQNPLGGDWKSGAKLRKIKQTKAIKAKKIAFGLANSSYLFSNSFKFSPLHSLFTKDFFFPFNPLRGYFNLSFGSSEIPLFKGLSLSAVGRFACQTPKPWLFRGFCVSLRRERANSVYGYRGSFI